MNQTKHLATIDQLRGMAILMVVVSHSFGYSKSISSVHLDSGIYNDLPNFLNFIFHLTLANGFLGVMIFFVLSGFCIRWSHLNTSRFTWKIFYQRRFFRILPAYWVWLVIGSLVANVKFWDFLLHALLLHNLRADSYHSIIAPLWSIAIEWQIYLLYPLILFISSKFDKRWVLIFFALANLGSSLLSSNPVAEIIGSDALRILGRLPTALMFAWMLGFYLANSIHEGSNIQYSPLALTLSLCAGILCYMHPNTIFLSSVPWSLAAYQLVALFVAKKVDLSFSRFDFLAGVGIISYSVYLSHDLFAILYPHFERFFLIVKGSFLAGATATCVLIIPMLLVGLLSYRFIELPGISLGRSWLFRSKTAVKGAQN